MISKKHRFHGRHSISTVFRKGQIIRSEFFSVKYFFSPGDTYRASVVVSKKVSKSAVVRNRIRRRIYENIRLVMDKKATIQNIDMVFTVYDQRINDLNPGELTLAIENLLKKAKIL